MKKINVKCSKKYSVYISDSFLGFNKAMISGLKSKKIMIITDQSVSCYLKEVKELFSGFSVYEKVLDSGEKTKNMDTIVGILDTLFDLGFSREDTIVALGGGVIGDISGFTASAYMRGINLIEIPTTLLSMVDSAIGGKNGINNNLGKNLIGSFYQPNGVYINTSLLKTLPQSQIKNGFGEVIKYSLLDGLVKREYIEKNDYENIILSSLKVKIKYFSKDEYDDKGVRSMLNLGHTIGHALEKISSFTLPHGECVVKGIKVAIDISKKYFNLNQSEYNLMLDKLLVKGHDLELNIDKNEIIKAIRQDKKFVDGKIGYIMLNGLYNPKKVMLLEQEFFNLLG